MKTKELRIFAIVISIFVLFAFASCQTSQAESPWYKTWREASEKAEETEQNILVFFSKVGVDEEGKPLDEASYALNNSFSKKSFKKKVAENYVLLNIDFSDPSGIDYSEYMEYLDF